MLEVDAGGIDPAGHVKSPAIAETHFAVYLRQFFPRHTLFHGFHKGGDGAVYEYFVAFVLLVQMSEYKRQVPIGPVMVAAAEHESLVRLGTEVDARSEVFKAFLGGAHVGRVEVGRTVSDIGQVFHEDLGSIGGDPLVFGWLLTRLATESTPYDGAVDAKTLQDLRHLGNVSKRIGDIADIHTSTKGMGRLASTNQVADRGLATY